ncbi:unnamed protein product [Moneuplotes crassus]|uniref:Uncharacterized protein n=1 Tax=Euplotes crassus TaxID=5936 RepID=A0AAD1U809_EUPCR|nr:unnamed protein product [Moneuplotes crassus]
MFIQTLNPTRTHSLPILQHPPQPQKEGRQQKSIEVKLSHQNMQSSVFKNSRIKQSTDNSPVNINKKGNTMTKDRLVNTHTKLHQSFNNKYRKYMIEKEDASKLSKMHTFLNRYLNESEVNINGSQMVDKSIAREDTDYDFQFYTNENEFLNNDSKTFIQELSKKSYKHQVVHKDIHLKTSSLKSKGNAMTTIQQ